MKDLRSRLIEKVTGEETGGFFSWPRKWHLESGQGICVGLFQKRMNQHRGWGILHGSLMSDKSGWGELTRANLRLRPR